MEYTISNANGQASVLARPRRPRRGNQFALVIAAVVLIFWGPLNIPFLSIKGKSGRALDGLSSRGAWSYDDVLSSLQHLEYGGVKYASVSLSASTRGAVVHALASKRVDGVVVLIDGCGKAVDRWLSHDGVAVMRGAGAAHFLPVVVEIGGAGGGLKPLGGGSESGSTTCGADVTPDTATKELLAAVSHLTQLAGVVGLPVVFAGAGDSVRFAVRATAERLVAAARDAEAAGGAASTTAAVLHGASAPRELDRDWRVFLGGQAKVLVALVTPAGADAAEPEGERDRLAANGVEVHRVPQQRCAAGAAGEAGGCGAGTTHAGMDPDSLRDALRWVGFRTRRP